MAGNLDLAEGIGLPNFPRFYGDDTVQMILLGFICRVALHRQVEAQIEV